MGDEFPPGYFFIRNVSSGKVIDVRGDSTDPGAEIVLWDRKGSDYDNQLWKHDKGFLMNKKSGLVLEVPGYAGGGQIQPDTGLIQAERRGEPDSRNQLWAYNNQSLFPYDPEVCISAKDGDVETRGVRVVVDIWQFGNVKQEWMFDTD
jgi:hypothetical protein